MVDGGEVTGRRAERGRGKGREEGFRGKLLLPESILWPSPRLCDQTPFSRKRHQTLFGLGEAVSVWGRGLCLRPGLGITLRFGCIGRVCLFSCAALS